MYIQVQQNANEICNKFIPNGFQKGLKHLTAIRKNVSQSHADPEISKSLSQPNK